MSDPRLDLSTGRLKLVLQATDGQVRLERLASDGAAWSHAQTASGLFGVVADGRRWEAGDLSLEDARPAPTAPGCQHVVLHLRGPALAIEQHLCLYAAGPLLETWQVVRNLSAAPVRIERLDSLALALPDRPTDLLAFTGNWGSEFEPQPQRLSGAVVLESRSGRSSKGHHPWFALTDEAGQVFSAAVAWSGNWVFRFEPLPGGGHVLTGGLHDWQFFKDLAPGAFLESPPVVVTLGDSLNAVAQQFTRVGRRHWYPRSPLSARLPVEWNHWWPYEDAEINEAVFARNVDVAAPMGFEVCTLDAGWFGPAEAGTFWEHYRGDWHRVNAQRFPGGLRALADQVHARGMKFGLWCEIEGLGARAAVAEAHPEYVALRDGERVGCVCFGNPQVQAWAYATLAGLIRDYGCDWIKVDFNLDPGAGCNRTDHGHQAGDGLYAHVAGYYATLDRLRQDFPEVVLENCSSGGLRIDLGLLRRTHLTYLSDPDWAVHDLQIFWGASLMLAPEVLLHWTYSHWRNLNPPPYQTFNPRAPGLTRRRWDYYARISMLGAFGLSQKLPDLPDWLAQRITEQIRLYQEHVRRFIKEADLFRLTDQPRRSGAGERWAAFQYSLPDQSDHLLFVFRLPGAEPARAIRLQGLQPDRLYTLAGLEGERHEQQLGRSLMDAGLLFTALDEEDSALLRVTPA